MSARIIKVKATPLSNKVKQQQTICLLHGSRTCSNILIGCGSRIQVYKTRNMELHQDSRSDFRYKHTQLAVENQVPHQGRVPHDSPTSDTPLRIEWRNGAQRYPPWWVNCQWWAAQSRILSGWKTTLLCLVLWTWFKRILLPLLLDQMIVGLVTMAAGPSSVWIMFFVWLLVASHSWYYSYARST
jgi:hypothetical protein